MPTTQCAVPLSQGSGKANRHGARLEGGLEGKVGAQEEEQRSVLQGREAAPGLVGGGVAQDHPQDRTGRCVVQLGQLLGRRALRRRGRDLRLPCSPLGHVRWRHPLHLAPLYHKQLFQKAEGGTEVEAVKGKGADKRRAGGYGREVGGRQGLRGQHRGHRTPLRQAVEGCVEVGRFRPGQRRGALGASKADAHSSIVRSPLLCALARPLALRCLQEVQRLDAGGGGVDRGQRALEALEEEHALLRAQPAAGKVSPQRGEQRGPPCLKGRNEVVRVCRHAAAPAAASSAPPRPAGIPHLIVICIAAVLPAAPLALAVAIVIAL